MISPMSGVSCDRRMLVAPATAFFIAAFATSVQAEARKEGPAVQALRHIGRGQRRPAAGLPNQLHAKRGATKWLASHAHGHRRR